MLVMNQPRPQAPGHDLVPDQGTPLPNNHSQNYKKWYNSNRPGKKERQAGAKARGIPPPPGVLKGHDTKGKDRKGKEKGKEKGKQYKGVPGKGKGQPGKVGGRTPPPPPPRKRPAAALVQPGDSQNPADEQEYSYYSTEEEGPQAKAKVQLKPNPAFMEHLRAGAAARRQGQEKGQAAAPQGPAGEPSSDSSTSDAEDDMPVSPVPKLGEDQDMEATKDDEATHQASKEPLLSPTEPATSPRDGSQGNNTPGEDQEEETTKPKPNPSEVTSPPDEPASPRATVEVNIGEPHPSPVSPGANQVQQPKPKEEDKQATSAKEATGPKEQATSPELVESPKGDGSSSSWAVAREALSQPKANHPEPDYNLTMTFTVKMRKGVNPCHSRYHPHVKVTYSGCHQAGDTSLDLVVVGLGGSRIVTHAPHRPGVVWKLSTYPQDPEVQICRVFGAITPGLIKKAGVLVQTRRPFGSTSSRWRR